MGKLLEVNWSYQYDRIKDRWLYILCILALIFIPWMSQIPVIGSLYSDSQDLEILPNNTFILWILTRCAIIAIFAASWDLLSGVSGQVSFGHALFLGTGSYLATFGMIGLTVNEKEIFSKAVSNPQRIASIEIDLAILIAIMVGALLCALLAFILGVITLRIRGPYFALVTLVLPLIALLLVKDVWEDYTGGNQGIPGIPRLVVPQENDLTVDRYQDEYIVTLFLLFVSVLFMIVLARSRFGTVLQAIREDERAASASGINVSLYKVMVFSISAFFAGLAGALDSQILNSSTSGMFGTTRSFEVIIYTILGGIGSITGAVVGSFIMVFIVSIYLNEAFVDTPTIETLSLGVILIIALRYQPRGLIRADKRVRNALLFGIIIAVVTAFYDAGKILSSISEKISLEELLVDNFGDSGLLSIDVLAPQGRLLIYFIVGTVMGYFGPDMFRAIRLKLWGVWPSIGNYEPPK
jgi:branched-chain amino acid transport system permease protein